MALLQSIHAIQLPEGEAGAWFQLLPAGTFHGRDGRGPYVNDNPDGVVAAFSAMKCDLSCDYDHQRLKAADKSGAVPASGWGKELQNRDGEIWARIEWTETAAACLQKKEYRYISPVFLHDEAGRIKAITMASLTNEPNLLMQAAASRQEGIVDELFERLCYLLNLPLTTTKEEMLTHLDKLKAMVAGTEAAAQMRAALGLGEDAQLPELATAMQSRLTAAATPDPTKWVPMEVYQTAAQSLTTLQEDRRTTEAKALVQAAQSAGKVTPALETWALGFARLDPDGFKGWVDKAPVVVAPHSQTHQAPPPGTTTLTDDQEACVAAMGIDREAYLKTLSEGKE